MSDLISRSAALKAVNTYDYRGMSISDVRTITDGCAEKIRRLPYVDAMPKWINVEERLPELDAQINAYDVTEEVLAIDKYGECYLGRFYIFKYQGDVVFISEDRTDVTHWMPLPEPPKEEE